MKINPKDLLNVVQQQKKLKQTEAAAGQFGAILEKAMTPQTSQTSSTNALSSVQSLSSLNFTTPINVENSKTIGRVNELLNLIESYQKKLADPAASLKDVYPLVQQMEKKSAELIPVCESLPDGNKLKDVLNRIIITSTVEVIKFNRGDYV